MWYTLTNQEQRRKVWYIRIFEGKFIKAIGSALAVHKASLTFLFPFTFVGEQAVVRAGYALDGDLSSPCLQRVLQRSTHMANWADVNLWQRECCPLKSCRSAISGLESWPFLGTGPRSWATSQQSFASNLALPCNVPGTGSIYSSDNSYTNNQVQRNEKVGHWVQLGRVWPPCYSVMLFP